MGVVHFDTSIGLVRETGNKNYVYTGGVWKETQTAAAGGADVRKKIIQAYMRIAA